MKRRRKRRRTDYGRLCIIAVLVLIVTILSAGATDSSRIVTDARDKEEKDKGASVSTGFHEIKIVGRDNDKEVDPAEYVNFDLAHLSIVGRDEDGNDGRVRTGDAEERSDAVSGDHQDGAGSDIDTDLNEDEDGLDESGVTEYSGDPAADSEHTGENAEGWDDTGGDWDTELSDSDMGSDGDSGLIDEQPDGDSGVDEQGFTDTEQWSSNSSESDESSGNDGSEDNPGGSTAGELGASDNGGDLTYLGNWTATAYCACSICTGVYSSGYTASGTLATEGRTIACNSLPFGTQIYIDGYGYYTVEDTGWSPYGDAWLDLFFESHDRALAFGLRNVDVYVVN